MGRVAVVLGTAECWLEDYYFAVSLLPSDHLVYAVKYAGVLWSGHLRAWCSLHPEKWEKWIAERRGLGYPDPDLWFSHRLPRRGGRRQETWSLPQGTIVEDFKWPGEEQSGSTSLFATRMALRECTRIVLCGCPMDASFGNVRPNSERFSSHVQGFRYTWERVAPRLGDRVRSCSGWTASLLGRPTRQWIEDDSGV